MAYPQHSESGSMRRTAAVVTLALTTVLAAGFASAGEAFAADPEAAADAGEIPAGLEIFYGQQIEWGSCDGYSTDGSDLSALECAKVNVPVDYEDPAGQTAQIALSRMPAAGEKIGSLLVNPGGPGASGLGMAVAGTGTPLAEHFDVVGFDPRGIGASTPQIVCLTAEEKDEQRSETGDQSPDTVAEAEQEAQEFAAQCAERTGTDLLANVGTRDVARDMDVIRAVLGDRQLTYLGYSYGTRLGTVYAEQFPQNVRAMVLDGALDPQQDFAEQMLEQMTGFQRAFDSFAERCTTLTGCPLGADPAASVQRFRELVAPLLDSPATTADGRGLSYGDAMTGVIAALYSPAGWEPLMAGLDELTAGNGDTLQMFADLYQGRSADGTYSNSAEALTAVRCVDDPVTTDRTALGELDTQIREAAPFLDDGHGTGEAPLDPCAFWPVPTTSSPHTVDAPGLAPVLVVSTTEDPATPYQAGVDLADQLDGVLVTYRGTQHGVVLSGQWCVDKPVVSYLVDLAVPEGDLTC
ncbi:alpha/beta hydrolase [Rhodococcus zopfii]